MERMSDFEATARHGSIELAYAIEIFGSSLASRIYVPHLYICVGDCMSRTMTIQDTIAVRYCLASSFGSPLISLRRYH